MSVSLHSWAFKIATDLPSLVDNPGEGVSDCLSYSEYYLLSGFECTRFRCQGIFDRCLLMRFGLLPMSFY